MSGGTATATLLNFAADAANIFNFTLGSTGILTILNGGTDYTTNFETFITDGDIRINSLSATSADFQITYNSAVSTSIQLIPEPTTASRKPL